MKKLIYLNREFEAERIVQGSDSVVGYIDNKEVFKFSGVSDFSGFTLTEGQTFDEPELSEVEILKEQVLMQQAIIDELLFDILPNLITDEEVV